MYLTIFGAPYGMYLIKKLHLLKCHLSGQRDAKLLSCYRQTVFKDGVVFYLAIWEVLRQGNMINNSFCNVIYKRK